MKIRNVSCSQFAGLQNRDVAFTDGINIIYGQNESGKSTLVNLLSKTLFQNARINRKTDKEFCGLYFPGPKKGSHVFGDTIDGEISVETDKGIYKLTKEWGADARCKLSTPDGDIIRNQDTIDELLRGILLYGEGVYSSILLSSQRNTDTALQTILDASKKDGDKQEIADAITLAFAESDGISVDAIEQAVAQKIKDLGGGHWNTELEMPEPKRGGGRWERDRGEILEAYYAMEDARGELDEISELEERADQAAADYKEKESIALEAEKAFNQFNTYAGSLIAHSERQKRISRLKEDMGRYENVMKEWPVLDECLERAEALQKEQQNARLAERYRAALKVKEELAGIDHSLANALCPTGEEIQKVKVAQRGISKLENQLCGMNLKAQLKMLEGHKVEIKSLVTGEIINTDDQEISVTGAVLVTVPKVMEMRLYPANVNTEQVETGIKEQREIVATTLKKYGVDSLEALEERAEAVLEAKKALTQCNDKLAMVLGTTTTFEVLEKAVTEIPSDTRGLDDIEEDIVNLCGDNGIGSFIATQKANIDNYVREYGSIDGVKVKAFDCQKELGKAQQAVQEVEKIPDAYRDFFIDWNKFWDGCGEMTAEGYIQPDDKYIKDMFFRKPGLPILMVRFPDGREVPYWNTFYQQVWEEDGERRYLGQMDLNVRSDKVWEFYDDTLKKLSSYGTRLVRLDAFAYAAKSPGKRNFMNEPDTWDILEKVRVLAGKYGMKLLPEIHASYAEKVYELVASKGYMIYDFFLPGLLIDALERGDATPLAGWARELVLKNIWAVNMLGCHDGIPMLDLKGLVPDEQIQSLIDTIVSRGGYIKNLHGKKDMYYQVNATYFSALGENEKKLLLARAVQLFMPGKPQVWYLDLFAGKNDHKAVELAGPGGHKEINRTNLTLDRIHAEMEKPLFRDQVALLRMRSDCPTFAADAQIAVECDQNGILTLSWAKGDACAQLKADFRTLGFTAVTAEGGKETFRMER